MQDSLKDRSIIVTGAGRGIGEAIARGLGEASAHITAQASVP